MTSQELKDIRKAMGLNQTDFARAIGVSMQAVAAWEQGQRPISSLVENAIENVVKGRGE